MRIIWRYFLVATLLAGNLSAADIAFDAKAKNNDETASTAVLSATHVVGAGASRMLCIWVGARDGSEPTVSSVTVGGIPATFKRAGTRGSGFSKVELWILPNPPTGSQVVTATWSANIDFKTIVTGSFFNVSPFLGATFDDEQCLDPTASIVPTVKNSWIVDGMHSQDGVTPAPGAGQTLIDKAINTGDTRALACSYEPTNGQSTVAMSWEAFVGCSSHVLAELLPATSELSPYLKNSNRLLLTPPRPSWVP